MSEEEFQDDFQKFIYKGEKYKLSHKKKISYSEHLNSIFSSLQLIEFLNYDCFGEEDITDFISNHLKICFGQ